MNPHMLGLIEDALARGFEVLVLTNAMQPMQRPRIKSGLIELNRRFGARLTLRVSLDHHGRALHEAERGSRTWARTLAGLDWLASNGFKIAIAGRTCWGESEAEARAGYGRLIAEHAWPIDPARPAELMLLPEMDGSARRPGNHHALLGHPEQEPRRHDVCVEPHGGQAAGRGNAHGAALHAHSLRSHLRDGIDAGASGSRPTAACSSPAP